MSVLNLGFISLQAIHEAPVRAVLVTLKCDQSDR